MKTPLYLGVDLGGTNIKAGLVDDEGSICGEGTCPTLPERGQKEVISALAALCFETIEKAGRTIADIRAAGVGVPGVVDADSGVVLSAPNLFWKDNRGPRKAELSGDKEEQRRVGGFTHPRESERSEVCSDNRGPRKAELSGDKEEQRRVGGFTHPRESERSEVCSDVALGPFLEESLSCPVILDNDANMAAIAEHAAGAAKGYSDALVVTLGTGVGAGVIVNGRLLRGAHGLAGEIGHMTLYPDGALCNCKNRGCFEMYASARALREMGMRAVEEDAACMLAQAVRGNKELVTAELVVQCAQKGDAPSLFIWERYTDALALGLSNAARVTDPQIIVIGGGVAKAGEFLLTPLREKISRLSIGDTAKPAVIACARFLAQAGIVGAAMLARSVL